MAEMRSLGRVVAAAFIAVFAIAGNAQADPIAIPAGGLSLGRPGDFGTFMELVTPTGQVLQGVNRSHPPAELDEFLCATCAQPHTAASFHAVFDVTAGSFDTACFGCTYFGDFTFVAPSVRIPDVVGGVSTPFSMTGTLKAIDHFSGRQRLSFELTGKGTEIVGITPAIGTFVQYRFGETASTPEPATALFLASGAAILFIRRKSFLSAPNTIA